MPPGKNQSNESDCRQIGSFGPCRGSDPLEVLQCGMTFNDSRAHGGEIVLVWQYEDACINTFEIELSSGQDNAPNVTAHEPNSCYWQTQWTGFRRPSAPPHSTLPRDHTSMDTSTVVAAVVVVLVLVMGCLLQAGRLQRRQDGRATNAKLLDDAELLSEQSNGS
eukprot:COSAG02_NODE_4207_length_5627_cov_5.695731_1_plen_164_part_00